LVEVGASRCLLGLAPAGVYHAASVAVRAVSSYLAFSPLPDPKIVGGVFSVALSVVPAETVTPRHYLAARPMEPGLSSIIVPSERRSRPPGCDYAKS